MPKGSKTLSSRKELSHLISKRGTKTYTLSGELCLEEEFVLGPLSSQPSVVLGIEHEEYLGRAQISIPGEVIRPLIDYLVEFFEDKINEEES